MGFTGAGLDRADQLRSDAAALAAAVADPRARVLALAGLDPVLDADGRLAWEPIADAHADAGAPLILVGLEAGAPRFAPLVAAVPVGARPAHLARVLAAMDGRDAAIWGTARSLCEWHNRTRFCGLCGGATEVIRAGWGRRCAPHDHEHFPRVDPVVIMLAEHGGRVLVGRQPRFPPRVYSALAGFLEPGESIEEAVARELYEEAGVVATSVRYVASQPWPFPHQLMIGCVATVAAETLVLDRIEIEDAMWVGRDDVSAALAGEAGSRFIAPPRYAIAHTLLRAWVEE